MRTTIRTTTITPTMRIGTTVPHTAIGLPTATDLSTATDPLTAIAPHHTATVPQTAIAPQIATVLQMATGLRTGTDPHIATLFARPVMATAPTDRTATHTAIGAIANITAMATG